MYLIRKIKEDGSYIDSYHHDLIKATNILGGHYGLILDLNNLVGGYGFKIVKSNM